ncbi:MAG TPA: hypothetical protein VGC09_03670 [Rhodopila sp.]
MKRLLALGCVVLLAVITAEVVGGADTGADASRRAAAVRLFPPAPKQTVEAAGSPDGWLAEVLARPLFAPDRKPLPGTTAADPGMPRLTGIIASADAKVAIFQPAGDAKPLVARFGEMVGGWEVAAISANAVNLRKQNAVVVLSPRFNGTAPAAAAVQEVRKIRPRWEVAASKGLLRARWSNPQLQP